MTPIQLRAAIEQSGLTKEQFADALGVELRTVNRWLSEDRKISRSIALLIELTFGNQEQKK